MNVRSRLLVTCLLLAPLFTVWSHPDVVAADVRKSSSIDFSGFDQSARPQDDFFNFVNGGWIQKTDIPSDQGRWGSFLILRDQANENVRTIVEELEKAADLEPGSELQKVRDLYRSYLDESRVNELAARPIEAELARVDAIADRKQLAEYFARAARLGIPTPLNPGVAQDARQPDAYIVYLSQAGLGMPDRDYYLDEGPRAEQLRNKYVAYVAKLLELAGTSDPTEKAQAIMRLETALAKIQWTRVQNRDREKTYNRVETAGLKVQLDGLDWPAYLDGVGIADQGAVVVRQPTYLEGLGKMLSDQELAAWKDYLRLRVISSSAGLLSQPFFDADFDFYQRTVRGIEQPEPRWKRGVNLLDATVGQLVGKEYIRRHFPEEAKKRMEKLVDNLKLAMRDSLGHLEWMTEATQREALAKLEKFNTKIGYPDVWKDYARLEIRPDDLVGNMRRAAQFEHDRELAKLGAPVDRTEWLMNPQTVNAYYNPLLNEIVFPAAILQPPFFNLDADDAVNYGAIGAVIGHEIGHGFDDQGRKSDGTGLLRDWWTRKDSDEYTKRAEKLVEQYEQYAPLDDARINGRLTLGENLGDLGGITIAYRAYQRSLNGQPAATLDGYTGNQRFFLSFAQIWRMKAREDFVRQQVKTDPHSPPRFRVIGVLRNFDPFYEAFGVKEKDAMYLPEEERVRIW